MLRINAIPNTAAAKAYYALSDYMIEGEQLVAYWHGKGAELLGLEGIVAQEDFERLCDNLHPQTGLQLTAKHIENRRVGYDLTFSVSKSVSLLYALGHDDRLPNEFRGAVADTMAEVEREMSTRVRKAGRDEDRKTGNLIWTDFLHHTSRPINGTPDPQLHIHAVVFNATFDHEESQWKAGQFGGIKKDAPYFQAMFRTRLANRLQDLGYEIKRTKDDFEVIGVPERTLKEFSRRTTLIEKLADQLGVTKPETKAKLGATSREAKKEGQTWDSLLRGWESRVTLRERHAILETASHREPFAMELGNAEALDWAMRHSFERSSVVTERELVTTALKHGLGKVTPEGIYKELGLRKDLIRRDLEGRNVVTTQGVLNEEKRVLEFAQKGRGKWRPMQMVGAEGGYRAHYFGLEDRNVSINTSPASGNPATIPAFDQAVNQFRDAAKMDYSRSGINRPSGAHNAPNLPEREQPPRILSVTQQAAVRHALSSRDPLILIRGAAGTGKTTMTRDLLEQVNVPWVILAPSAEASRGVLRREGFQDADTLAHFLLDEETREKARNGLIVLDEASLVGAHDMSRLVESATELNARIVMLGDRRQHKSVARGDILALLEDRAGLPVAEVSEIRRQSGEYKSAVSLASKGNVAAAVKKLDEMGWVKEMDQFADAGKAIADEYVAGLNAGKTMLVVSPTHAEGDRVTAAIREKLKQEGKLDGKEEKVTALQAVNLTQAEASDAETLRTHAGETACFIRHGLVPAGQRITITEENAEVLAKQGSRFAIYRPKELNLSAGDLLRVTSGIKDTSGKRIDNGAMLTYLGSENGKLLVETASGTKRFLLQNVGHVSYGYVSTSHSAQGKTVDRVLIYAPTASFGAVDKSTGYVAISRGRQKATIFTDDRQTLLEAVEREKPRMLASELVRRPRHRIREKLKRHVAFLRDLGNEITRKAREVVRPRERDLAMER